MTLKLYRPATMVASSFGIGGAITATEITSLASIFATSPGYNTYNATPLYSCFYIQNTLAGRTYNSISIGVSRVGTTKSTISIGKASTKNTAIPVINSATPLNAPAGVTFGTTVTLTGSIVQNDYWGIWLKRLPNSWSSYTSTSTADADVRISISASYT